MPSPVKNRPSLTASASLLNANPTPVFDSYNALAPSARKIRPFCGKQYVPHETKSGELLLSGRIINVLLIPLVLLFVAAISVACTAHIRRVEPGRRINGEGSKVGLVLTAP